MDKLSTMGATLMLQIRAKAASAGSAVYPKAMIPPPNKPSPTDKPGTPTGFTAQLLGIGWIELGWKCSNPRDSQGTMYEVERQISGAGGYQFLGTVGTKKFIDHSIPPGATQVVYRVRAIRSTKRGNVAMHLVPLHSLMPHKIPSMHDTGEVTMLSAA
jgi:hypothetical protein